MKETIYYVSGMHCSSCELLIEKKLLKQNGVKAVDVSLSNGSVRIEHAANVPSTNKLNQWFKADGYTFSDKPEEEKKELLFYVEEGKQGIRVDRKVLKRKMKTLGNVALVFVILLLIERTGIAQYVSVTGTSSLWVFFLFGLVAGLSSCAALIGGILLSLTKRWNQQHGYDATRLQKMKPQFQFHLGRLFAYGAFGAFLGAIGNVIALDNVTIYALITIAVSVVMLIVGLQMVGVRWAERIQIRMPKAITRKVATAGKKNNGSRMPMLIGAGTVILPCGFTLVAQGVALTSGSATTGALMLMAFVLGTMIPLLGIGLLSIEGTRNAARARAFSFYAGVTLVIFGLYNVNGQLNVLGVPSVSDVFVSSPAADEAELIVPTGATQEVMIDAEGFEYTFTGGSQIKAGVSTTLVVNNKGILGCGAFMASRGLIDGFVSLKKGINRIDVGTPQKGTYKITCSMGMVPPITLVVQ